MMTPELYKQAATLFERLREVQDHQLPAALDDACAGDAELRARVMLLIEADRCATQGSFLAGRAIEEAARLITPTPLAAGTILGNYRLQTQIGAGGMGVVYEAEDLRLNRRVAVKILPFTAGPEAEERIRRFQREARAASTLNHPHIVSIFDADVDRGCHYMAMELVEGQTLRQFMRAQVSPPDGQMILEWTSQISSALSAAHQADIVHRDVKPENIMIRPDGFLKVLDFGLAKLRDPIAGSAADFRTNPGHVAGTIAYLSPEQIEGRATGPRSDLFSLGVVAYELATGVRPFAGPNDGATMQAILNHQPPPPSALRPSLGAELDALIMRALEKDPELRFQTAGDLRSACRRVTRDFLVKTSSRDSHSDVGLAPGVPAPVQASSTPRRNPYGKFAVPAAAAAAAVIVILGAIAIFWAARAPEPLRVARVVQITHGEATQRFVSDGARLFYAAGNRDASMKMYQVSTKGGDPVPLPRLTGMLPLDIAADGSEMLLGQILATPHNKGFIDGPFPIWRADTLGNPPRRVADLMASEARWSPQGDRILYSQGTKLWLARGDGTGSRLLADLGVLPLTPTWSPDGRSIRFVLRKEGRTLWEMDVDSSHRRQLFPEMKETIGLGLSWTPDGRLFFFSAGTQGARDLWALREAGRPFWSRSPAPQRLTTGPIKSDLPWVNLREKRLFFNAAIDSGELVRYDRKQGRWEPYLGGPPAMQVEHSPDGKWIAYVRSPERSIWRSTIDGKESVRLTDPPLVTLNPRWSPDGTQITFFGERPGERAHVFVVPAAGGAIKQVPAVDGSIKEDDGNWSPDGKSLVFAAQFGDESLEVEQRFALQVADLSTGKVAKLPGSGGLWAPRLSAGGRYVAALGFPNRIWLYDMTTRQARQLTDIGAGWISWSKDHRFIYFQESPGEHWSRVSIGGGHVERVLSTKGLVTTLGSFGWIGLAPDGSPISARSTGGPHIFALDWEE